MFNERLIRRLRKIDEVIDRQRAFLYRVPDPDTRERAEGHLLTLIEMREQIAASLSPA